MPTTPQSDVPDAWEAMSTTAEKLVKYYRHGKVDQALDECFDQDAVSVEATESEIGRKKLGIEEIRSKHKWFREFFAVKLVSGPLKHYDDRFAIIFELSARAKNMGQIGREVAVYKTNAEGKIVCEEFFYSAKSALLLVPNRERPKEPKPAVDPDAPLRAG